MVKYNYIQLVHLLYLPLLSYLLLFKQTERTSNQLKINQTFILKYSFVHFNKFPFKRNFDCLISLN